MNTLIDNYTVEETLETVERAIREKRQIHHVVVNAGKMVAMQKDSQLRESVNSSDLINADGQAVVWASRILGQPLKERVAGIDLMEYLVEMAGEKGYRIYFLGAREEVVSRVVALYREKHGDGIIAGYRNGYFNEADEPRIAEEIGRSGANILFVAISSPKKEHFLYKYRKVLKEVNLIMGVGGSFDVVSGTLKRAPKWMQRSGLEWFYRLLQEPGRMWKRYLFGNASFIWMVFTEWRKKYD